MPDGFTFEFTCVGCGTHKVTTRYRGMFEDISHYMKQAVQPALGNYHMLHSPNCKETKCDLKLPMQEDKPIGGKPDA